MSWLANSSFYLVALCHPPSGSLLTLIQLLGLGFVQNASLPQSQPAQCRTKMLLLQARCLSGRCQSSRTPFGISSFRHHFPVFIAVQQGPEASHSLPSQCSRSGKCSCFHLSRPLCNQLATCIVLGYTSDSKCSCNCMSLLVNRASWPVRRKVCIIITS